MKKIGRFTITGLLGKGGMGRVYKVTYPVTGKVAALKLLDPSALLAGLTPARDLEAMFTKEAVTMASIRHPHVVDILDFGRSDGHLYYVMDFFCNNLGTLMGESNEAGETRVSPLKRRSTIPPRPSRACFAFIFSASSTGISSRPIS
jgi:serine/threonine protein kinase